MASVEFVVFAVRRLGTDVQQGLNGSSEMLAGRKCGQ
jgi:hypothetical protein